MDCPYGEEDFKRRMYWYEKTISEKGIPNGIYDYLKPEDVPDEFEQFLWCDKVGGKVSWYGRCSVACQYPLIQTRNITHKKKRSNKRERDLKHKRHLERLWDAKKNWLFPPALYVEDKSYYKKLTPNHGGTYQRFYKKISNKKVRRYKYGISKGSNYKKVFDYWRIVS